MADPSPAKRVYVTVNEIRYELVPTDKLTFPETKEAKRVSEGMSLAEIEEGIKNVDPDAWFAWMYVSIRRSWPKLTPAELTQAIGDTPIAAIIESVEEEASEVAGGDPPAQRLPSVEPVQQNGNGSGEKTPELSTLETAGHRDS